MRADVTVRAIAHRAGNSLSALRQAVELGADVVECDVHSARGRLEVRHLKSLGPAPWLWDRWYLVPTTVPQLRLEDLLDAWDGRTTLMLDLKGVGPVGGQVARAVHARAPDVPVLVCARWWPAVDAVARHEWARPVLSARGRTDLGRLRRRVRVRPPYGVSVHRSLLTAEVVGELRERVELVTTWPVEDLVTLREVVALGVSGVTSSSPEVLRAVTASR